MRPLARLVVLLLLAVLTTTGGAAATPDMEELTIQIEGRSVLFFARFGNAFPPEVVTRLESGLEVTFECTVRLKRRRGRLRDKTVAERYVAVSAQYSNLTKMYKISRRVDGAVTDFDITERPELMRRWMTEVQGLRLFEERDVGAPGEYYLSAQVRSLGRYRMYIIPWDLVSDWRASPRFGVDDRGDLRMLGGGGGTP